MSRRITRTTAAAALCLSLSLGVGAPAMAATAPTTVERTAISLSAPAPLPSNNGSLQSTTLGGNATGPTTSESAFWQRIAVKAALETLKRTNKKLYNKIVSKVGLGKKAFVKWYDKNIKPNVPAVLTGISAAAIYDVITWILGF
ncbi:hypothetical protein [Glutamicibacter uratoxydans]|uniref:hypothetical protein n=1 Tax=Glutamicibacter uratoxydans TaxID=43667 RepID=UPI003D6DECEB